MTTTDPRTVTDPIQAPSSPAPTSQYDAGKPLTLGDFAPGGTREGQPAVTHLGMDVVVLSHNADDAGRVDVHTPHGLQTLSANTSASPVTDPDQCSNLLPAAVTHLADQLRDIRLDRTCLTAQHERTLEEIRRYAIDQHLEGQYCRDGLNTFLRTFHLPTYNPRTRITYIITGSYNVDTPQPDDARRDAAGYLAVDLSEVDNIIDDTHAFTIDITDATALDD